MDNKQKQTKKLFCAPSKKPSSDEELRDVSKEKMHTVGAKFQKSLTKANSTECETSLESKGNEDSQKVPGAGVKKKSAQKTKSVARSLTDKEYSDIFQSVLDEALNNESSTAVVCKPSPDLPKKKKCTANILLSKPCATTASSSDAKGAKAEMCDSLNNLPRDECSEGSEEKHQNGRMALHEKKKSKDKPKSVKVKLPKKEKKPDRLKKFDDSTTAHGNSLRNSDEEENDSEEETGTWIQCSIPTCSKWRYVADVSDPIRVPDHWECRMNSDNNRNTCEAPEVEYDERNHILTKFTLGSVVWVKMDSFPWWPAMIDSDPDYDTYFELPTANSLIPYLYHVTFFDKHVSRAWMKSHLITPYNLKDKNVSKSQANKKQVQAVMKVAEEALKLSLQERLDKYCFLNRYSKSRMKRKPLEEMSQRKKTKESTQKDGSARKEDITETILTSSGTMMRELEMAIQCCNDGDDADISEDEMSELDEYVPRVSRTRNVTADDKDSMSQDGEKTEQEERGSIDLSLDNGAEKRDSQEQNSKEGNKTFEKSSCSVRNLFDPTVFTMELDTQVYSSQETEKKDDKFGHNQLDVSGMVDGNGKIRSPDKTKLKCKKKNKKKVKTDSLSGDKEIKANCSKSINDAERELSKGYQLVTKNDFEDKSEIEFDSEKENEDPKHSKNEKLASSKKRKNEEKSEKTAKNKKKKGNRENKSKEVPCAKQVDVKTEDEEEKLSGDESRKNTKSMKLDAKELSQGTDKGTRSKTKRCIGNNLLNNENNRSTCNEKLKTPKDEKVSHVGDEDVSVEGGKQSREKSKIGKKKMSLKSASFVNPTNVSKSDDRSVPTVHSENRKPPRKNCKEKDQYVPDLTATYVVDDVVFSCSELEMENICHKAKNDEKKGGDFEEEDELNLSIDSLEDENLMNIESTGTDDKIGHVEQDKHEYGRFGGHCSDHASDSDPFEKIED